MPSLFSRIVAGEIPCHKILEDNQYLAFLDIRPINPGHTLVIPKLEIDYLFDLEDSLLSSLIIFAKRAAKMIQKAIPCKRIGVMVVGLEVPHAHVHLVPINSISDLSFARAKSMHEEDLVKIARSIKSFSASSK